MVAGDTPVRMDLNGPVSSRLIWEPGITRIANYPSVLANLTVSNDRLERGFPRVDNPG
jgi:hypothetical protein